MRNLIKGDIPQILVEREADWTQELMDYIQSEQKVPKTVKSRYNDKNIKNALMAETNDKCAYCESKITHISHGDIEHILPKSKVHDKTFSWDNLTIGCSICNLNKKDYYDPSTPLLNPYTDNPEKKLIFCGPLIFSAAGEISAEVTIKILKLDRTELLERRVEHLNNLDPLLKQFQLSENPTLKELILNDIKNMYKSDKEFSLMTEQFVNQRLLVTA